MINERRLFISIDLPKTVRETIREHIQIDKERVPELYMHARIMDEASWHITVLFLGTQPEQAIGIIEKNMREAIKTMAIPQITLNTLTTAPPHHPPRMIWATTDNRTNDLLGALKKKLEQDLSKQGILPKGERHPLFNGHVTVARFPEGSRLPKHTIPLPTEKTTFAPTSIDLMESHLEQKEVRYTLLKSVDCNPSV